VLANKKERNKKYTLKYKKNFLSQGQGYATRDDAALPAHKLIYDYYTRADFLCPRGTVNPRKVGSQRVASTFHFAAAKGLLSCVEVDHEKVFITANSLLVFFFAQAHLFFFSFRTHIPYTYGSWLLFIVQFYELDAIICC